MRPDLNEMAVFAAVAEHGSFTKAANTLDMPKSSVSRHVSQLEERLGERLLSRTTRSIQLTEVGKLYLKYCRRIVEEADAAQSALLAMQSQPAGLLKVSAPLAFGAPILQNLFNEFLSLYPKVNFELHLDNKLVDLVEDGIDLAVRVGPLTESSLVARKLATSVMCMCATPAFIARYGEPKTLEDLDKFDVIKHPGIDLILEGGSLVSTHTRFAVNDMGIVKSMVLWNYGIGLVPLPLVCDEIAQGELVPLLLDYPIEQRDFFLVYPSRRQLAAKTEVFVNFMLDKISQMDQWNVSVVGYLERLQQHNEKSQIRAVPR